MRNVLASVPAGMEPDYGAEWDQFWSAVAEAATAEISRVSVDHPDGARLRAACRAARRAAGLPPLRFA